MASGVKELSECEGRSCYSVLAVLGCGVLAGSRLDQTPWASSSSKHKVSETRLADSKQKRRQRPIPRVQTREPMTIPVKLFGALYGGPHRPHVLSAMQCFMPQEPWFDYYHALYLPDLMISLETKAYLIK